MRFLPGTASFPYDVLTAVDHRPWPMPSSPWVMTQTWHDLLFAHWPVARDVLRARVPRQLDLDVYDGQAWIGVVPFHMTNVAPRGVPLPRVLSAFPELNVRTYVTCAGKPGVYFFSLDAASAAAVTTARVLFALPYYQASMRVSVAGDAIEYSSRRTGRSGTVASFEASYRPLGNPLAPHAGSLEYFVTERYCLYTVSRAGRVRRVDIHHPPWSLQRAEAEIRVNSMAEAAGIPLPSSAPLLHFARRQDAVAWLPQRV